MNTWILALPLLLLSCGKPDDTSDTDTDADTDSDSDSDTDLPNDWGFDMRVPQTRTLECAGGTHEFDDMDWLCTFPLQNVTGMIYIAATPTDCFETMSVVPSFEARGQIEIDGAISDLSSPMYDWGGNHHNDALDFDWDDQHFRMYHSSFGMGWRSCQPMDCMQVFESFGGEMVEDGCTCDRSLPTVCVQVQKDGTWVEFDDTFAVCDGDDTCG